MTGRKSKHWMRRGLRVFAWPALFLGLLVATGAGCGEEAPRRAPETPAGKPAKEKAEGKKGKAGDAKKTEGEEEGERLTYSYNPIGKRDPFRSFITKDSVAIENRPETPLQKYEIDQFRLVAIIWGIDDPVAMVEDPEGMGHFLRKGTLIGKNWGKVVRISPTEVIVAEEYRDFEGKLIVNEIPLKLESEGYE